jgi:hypothetical protein
LNQKEAAKVPEIQDSPSKEEKKDIGEQKRSAERLEKGKNAATEAKKDEAEKQRTNQLLQQMTQHRK